jgi:hypothetical protein
LVANRLTAAWKQGRQGGGRGYDYPTKVTPASGVAVLVENVSPLPRANIAGGAHAHPYHGRFALTASGRRTKACYVPSESEDIDLK